MAAGYFAILNYVAGALECLTYWPDLEAVQAKLEWRLWPLEAQQRGSDGRGNAKAGAYKGAGVPSAPAARGVLSGPVSVALKYYSAASVLLYDKVFTGSDSEMSIWISFFGLCCKQEGGWSTRINTY